jgi:hypothetical protein
MKLKKNKFEEFYCSPEELAALRKVAESDSVTFNDNDLGDNAGEYYDRLDEMIITRDIPPAKAIGNAALRKYLRGQ